MLGNAPGVSNARDACSHRRLAAARCGSRRTGRSRRTRPRRSGHRAAVLAPSCRRPPAPAAASPPRPRARAVEPGRRGARLRRGREHGAEDQVVEPPSAAARAASSRRVHRAADEEAGGATIAAHARRRHRIAAQVHAVRAGGQRDVDAIVDEDARACAAHRRRRSARPAASARAPSRSRSRTWTRCTPARAAARHALDQRLFAASGHRAAARSVIMQMTGRHVSLRPTCDERPIDEGGVAIDVARDEQRERARRCPPAMLTTPRPETAPRTKLLVMSACTQRQRLGEVVAVPVRRPRHDDQHEADLEEERDQQQPPHAPWLPAWARDSCSMRWRTSR